MFDEQLNFIAYGYFPDGLNSQNTWQGGYRADEDTKGRGYPDWVPAETTLIAPPSAKSRFVNGKWV